MKNENTTDFQAVLTHFGGKAKLAKALGISKQAVSAWGKQIPELRAYQIEAVSNGQFTAAALLENNHG